MEEVRKEPEIIENEGISEEEAGKQLLREKINFKKAAAAFRKRKKLFSLLLIVGVIAVVVLVGGIYLAGSRSNVRSIRIVNNDFLSDEYILKITDVSLDDKYLLLFPTIKEMKARESKLIEDISIKRGPDHSVIITVTEADIIGYRYDDRMELLLGDGSAVSFESGSIRSLSMLPMLIKVPEEKLKRVAEQFAQLDYDILTRISEVRDYALSYDDDMVKLVMDDGYKVYGNINDLPLMSYYLGVIRNASSNPNMCLYIDRVNNVFQLRSCSELDQMYENYLNPVPTEKPEKTDNKGENE